MQKVPSVIHSVIDLFLNAFRGVKEGVCPSPLVVEKWGIMISDVMSSGRRKYHDPSHIFSVVKNTHGPIEILAAIFHDLIYIQVDKEIHPKLHPYLKDFQILHQRGCVLPPHSDDRNDPILTIIYEIFGVTHGKILTPAVGLNELMSAVVAARVLKPYLSLWNLVQLIACIEQTIPFCCNSENSDFHFMTLKIRLQNVCEKFSIDVSSDQIDESIRMCVRVSNADVFGFAEKDSAEFLSHTWSLILESNAVLSNSFYLISEYRVSLEKLQSFYFYLKTDSIFRRHLEEPSLHKLNHLKKCAEQNIAISKEYLQLKILAITLIEAIAELTGGDAPVSLMTGGSYKDADAGSTHFENLLDPRVKKQEVNLDPVLLRLLVVGREGTSSFDLKHSPTAAYLYQRMSREEIMTAVEVGKKFVQKKALPRDVVFAIPKSVVCAVINAIAEVTPTRFDSLKELLVSLD